MDNNCRFQVIDHPLIRHKLTYIRDRLTGKKEFKELVDEVAMLMAFEITRDFSLEKARVQTPLMETDCEVLGDLQIVLVPILRAGIGMVDGIMRLIPSAKVGHVGLYRDHETLKPVTYYFKIPPLAENHQFILIDPMLATGGSAIEAVNILKKEGVKNIRFMCLIAAPEGVQAFCKAHPEIEVYAAALDERLNDKAYILPGLGDAGDRLFGTV
jgi:uracil phosphoribosyltransferase